MINFQMRIFGICVWSEYSEVENNLFDWEARKPIGDTAYNTTIEKSLRVPRRTKQLTVETYNEQIKLEEKDKQKHKNVFREVEEPHLIKEITLKVFERYTIFSSSIILTSRIRYVGSLDIPSEGCAKLADVGQEEREAARLIWFDGFSILKGFTYKFPASISVFKGSKKLLFFIRQIGAFRQHPLLCIGVKSKHQEL